jgi:hypothetical protein
MALKPEIAFIDKSLFAFIVKCCYRCKITRIAKEKVMTNSAVIVLTRKSIAKICNAGGSGNWALNSKRVMKTQYIICCRNRHHKEAPTDMPHGAGFLVAKIRDVVPVPSNPGRWIVKFEEFSQISKPGLWKGGRNPVRYKSLDELKINPDELEWERPTHSKEDLFVRASPNVDKPLTIAEAKRGLALTFDVDEGSIEITVRG